MILRGKCWVWMGDTLDGYAVAQVDNRQVYVHRTMYQLLIGPVPLNLELDHLCRVRACYNPFHLEPVTHAENVRRGASGVLRPMKTKSNTHCPAGHEMTESNTNVSKTKTGTRRHCKKCQAAASARYRGRRDSNPDELFWKEVRKSL